MTSKDSKKIQFLSKVLQEATSSSLSDLQVAQLEVVLKSLPPRSSFAELRAALEGNTALASVSSALNRLEGEGAYAVLFDADNCAPARAISISEPLCKAYVELFSDDFSEDEVRKEAAHSPFVDSENFDLILRRFLDGLANSRLELHGKTDDLAGWLATYLEAYVEPGDGEVNVPFPDWDSLTLQEQEEVKADSIRLTPILRKPWPDIWPH